jgi:hypothetical protein
MAAGGLGFVACQPAARAKQKQNLTPNYHNSLNLTNTWLGV